MRVLCFLALPRELVSMGLGDKFPLGIHIHETVIVPVNLTSRLEAPTLIPKFPLGTTQFWLATSQ